MSGVTRAESLHQLENQVGVLVRRIKRVIGERAQAVHPDLQPASFLMLNWLVEKGPVRASAMVDYFHVDKGAVSRQLQHLDDLGLVDRTPDPADGRATLVAASDDAVRRLQDVAEHRRKWLDEQLRDWSADELVSFASTLQRYNEALNA